MPEWLGAILFIAAIFGVSFLWEALKDKAKAKGGKSAAAAKGAEAIGTGVEWGMRILLGVAALAVGLFFLWFGIKDGAWQGWVGGIVLIAYAINLFRGGSVWIVY